MPTLRSYGLFSLVLVPPIFHSMEAYRYDPNYRTNISLRETNKKQKATKLHITNNFYETIGLLRKFHLMLVYLYLVKAINHRKSL